MVSGIQSVILMVFYFFEWYACGLDYSDLEALGVSCPSRDRCDGYKNNFSHEDRNCECDVSCASYDDCCIDAPFRWKDGQTPVWTDLQCLRYGKNGHAGVFVISNCSQNWTGHSEVSQKCIGRSDLRDPLAAAPATDVVHGVTYRNLYCAECNYANLSSLTFFHFQIECEDLLGLEEESIIADLTYNRWKRSWGVYRLDPIEKTSDFKKCNITFEVPSYLNDFVRFCRSNIISSCVPSWTRETVREACEEYMAVVYDSYNSYSVGYRNPHCAICNHATLRDLSCWNNAAVGKVPFGFHRLVDINRNVKSPIEEKSNSNPQCPSNHIYNPFIKRCRPLFCALPGSVLVNGKCVRT